MHAYWSIDIGVLHTTATEQLGDFVQQLHNVEAELRLDPRTAELPVIGLSSVVSADALERGRQVGLHDYVAKFDRQGLIAALKEQTDVSRAA